MDGEEIEAFGDCDWLIETAHRPSPLLSLTQVKKLPAFFSNPFAVRPTQLRYNGESLFRSGFLVRGVLMGSGKFQVGDWVIYRKTKFSEHPGPRAQHVRSLSGGDGYAYTVDKFWIVAESLADGQLRLKTRLGKEHVISADDPQLRRARWWERLFYRQRFEAVSVNAP